MDCPGCTAALETVPEYPAWCPACEWNLKVPEPVGHGRGMGRGPIDRRFVRDRLRDLLEPRVSSAHGP